MTKEREAHLIRCEEIIQRIGQIVWADGDNKDASVAFRNDWGPHSLTVEITGRGHTHVGDPEDDGGTFKRLVEQLHSTLNDGPGLSWA